MKKKRESAGSVPVTHIANQGKKFELHLSSRTAQKVIRMNGECDADDFSISALRCDVKHDWGGCELLDSQDDLAEMATVFHLAVGLRCRFERIYVVYNRFDLTLDNVRHDPVPEFGCDLCFFIDTACPNDRAKDPLTFDHEMGQVDGGHGSAGDTDNQ
jgi:hypothetical protein